MNGLELLFISDTGQRSFGWGFESIS